MAVEVMGELEIDISQARSKHLDEFSDEPIDLVITVCDGARDSCPSFARAKKTLHWPFFDPANATGSEDERRLVFRQVRDQIAEKIDAYLNS